MSILVEEDHEGIVTLTLNRPEAHNAISNALAVALAARLEGLAMRRDVRSVIIRGAGEKAFCAGTDLKERRNLSPDEKWAQRTLLYKVNRMIWRQPQPVIAAIDGYCMGGGFELALFCDFRIATEKSVFSFPEMALGAYPGAGGPIVLPKIVGRARSKEILFSARRVLASEAAELGIVDFLVSGDELLARAQTLARSFDASSPLGISAVKSLINQGTDLTVDSASDLNDALRRPLESTHDYEEGIRAFFEKRDPTFKGC